MTLKKTLEKPLLHLPRTIPTGRDRMIHFEVKYLIITIMINTVTKEN